MEEWERRRDIWALLLPTPFWALLLLFSSFFHNFWFEIKSLIHSYYYMLSFGLWNEISFHFFFGLFQAMFDHKENLEYHQSYHWTVKYKQMVFEEREI